MALFIIIILVIFIAFIVQAAREEEIKSNERIQLLTIYEKRLKIRLIALYIFGGILALGILLYCFGDLNKTVKVDTWFLGELTRSKWTATHYWAFFCTLIGAMGSVIAGIKAAKANSFAKKYDAMADGEYDTIKENLIKAEQVESFNGGDDDEGLGVKAFFETPPCPYCGSADTKTSDDYKAKQGAKMLGKVALSFLLGNYTNMNLTQRYVMGRNYNNSIHVDVEYQCKNCGYIWRPSPDATKKISSPNIEAQTKEPVNIIDDSSITMQTQPSIKDNIICLKNLLATGVITQEEFDNELHKTLMS